MVGERERGVDELGKMGMEEPKKKEIGTRTKTGNDNEREKSIR
jgi:hypothetical protein